MKIIIKAAPGEMEAKAGHFLRAAERFALIKGAKRPEDEADSELLIPALKDGLSRGHVEVERIRKHAMSKIAEVIGG
jgi:hypothetical protein